MMAGGGGATDRSWPFLPVNEGLNGAESDFRFVLESGRSDCTCLGRAVRLLMAESSHWMSYFADIFCDNRGTQ